MSAIFVKLLPIFRVIVLFGVALTIAVTCSKQLRRAETRGDVEVFFHAGKLVRAGENLYTVAEPRGKLYYLYPPLFAVLFVPFAGLTIEATIILWCLFNVFLVAWIVVAFYEAMTKQKFFDLPVLDQWVVGFFSVGLSVRAIHYHLDLAQANILVLAIAVFGLKLLSERREVGAGVAVGVSIVIKVLPLPLTLLFIGRRDARVSAGIGLGVILALLLPAFYLGFERNFAYLNYFYNNVLLTNDLHQNYHWAVKFNYSPVAQLYRFFGGVPAFEYKDQFYYVTIARLPNETIHLLGRLITALTGIAILLYAARYRRSSELVGLWGGAALALCLVPIFSPVAQKHYFVMLLPAHIYVVYLWYCLGLKDRWFRGLVVASQIVSTLSTSIFGFYPGAVINNTGGLIWGTLLLAASIFRAAALLDAQHKRDVALSNNQVQ